MKRIFLIITLTFLALTPISVQARSNTTTRETPQTTETPTRQLDRTKPRSQRISELRAMNAADRCQTLSANIERIIQNYDQAHQSQLAKYARIESNAITLKAKYESQGLDTSALQNIIDQLTVNKSEFVVLSQELQTKLRTSLDLVCGEDKDAYSQAVREAQSIISEMRELSKTMTRLISNLLKQELNTLRRSQGSARNI